MPQTSTPEVVPQGAKRSKGPRTVIACDSCRTRKVKCNGGFPCSSCTQNSFECSYKGRQSHIVHVRRDNEPSLTRSESQALPQPSSLGEATARRELRLAPRISPEDATIPGSLPGASEIAQDSGRDQPALRQDNSAGLDEVNWHTGGSEFYGRSGTFYFLAKLRSHANSGYPPPSQQQPRRDPSSRISVVNLLHSSDYTSPPRTDDTAGNERQDIAPLIQGRSLRADGINDQFELEIQRECVRLYFENLHCVHPILDRASFLNRCSKHVWLNGEKDSTVPNPRRKREKRRFLALFYVVLAIGAVVAGETSLLTDDETIRFLQTRGANSSFDNNPPYPPIRVALLYVEKSKALLDDVFESTSFETAQTLFLMSVFCQNALKPHSCYMYGGMAVRAALAIGIPTAKRATSEQERLFWWALYSFEIEMCSSSGRQPSLLSPDYYGISLPTVNDPVNSIAPFVNCMVDLAIILADVAANTNQFDDQSTMIEKSQQSAELEMRLEDWTASLPRVLDFKTASLTESELVMKQKTVLKLRYLNFRVLIYRPFLLLNTTEPSSTLNGHVLSSVESARELIRFVYETYLSRPYFRTWWYNCTYVLDASMVLLYVVLTNTCPLPVEEVLDDIDKSLEIFAAMKSLAVARRCTEIVSEVLSAAKRTHADFCLQGGGGAITNPGSAPMRLGGFPAPEIDLGPDETTVGVGTEGLSYEELYASLVDTNMVYNFLNFEDWSAWPGADDGIDQE